ncbi:hypothetical protein KC19_5G201100 [Ceratodon purpureus]|uniref:Uncharacterized protein n=1 Tax=Ceratodon purpureus TaxID=3225 RepID=A0A8T0I6A2_CERPU|nr:hypothetical protein KC19_5G201100 [Ceratodon purpureus]
MLDTRSNANETTRCCIGWRSCTFALLPTILSAALDIEGRNLDNSSISSFIS